MKVAVAILATALLCGCQKPATPETRVQRWEYKVVQLENFAGFMRHDASVEMDTNYDLGLKDFRNAESGSGDFIFSSNDTGGDKYSADLNFAGHDGWELISAVPQIETLPNVEYVANNDYNAATKKLDPRIEKFNNTRTGKIILIFKRPQK